MPTAFVVAGLWTVWATTLVAIKIGVTVASPLWFSFLRTVVAFVVLAVVVALVSERGLGPPVGAVHLICTVSSWA